MATEPFLNINTEPDSLNENSHPGNSCSVLIVSEVLFSNLSGLAEAGDACKTVNPPVAEIAAEPKAAFLKKFLLVVMQITFCQRSLSSLKTLIQLYIFTVPCFLVRR